LVKVGLLPPLFIRGRPYWVEKVLTSLRMVGASSQRTIAIVMPWPWLLAGSWSKPYALRICDGPYAFAGGLAASGVTLRMSRGLIDTMAVGTPWRVWKAATASAFARPSRTCRVATAAAHLGWFSAIRAEEAWSMRLWWACAEAAITALSSAGW